MMGEYEIQVIDVDYMNVNERPVLRIFGKTEKGESACVFYEGFMPYFYLSDERALKIIEGEPQVRDVREVKRHLPSDRGGERHMWKVVLGNPAKTPEVRDRILNGGFLAYEADILFKYRFMCDSGISGMGWIKVEGSETATNTVNTKLKIKADKIHPLKKDGDAPLRTLSFDIECVSEKTDDVPNPSRDPVVMISLVFSEPFRGKDGMVIASKQGPGVEGADGEKRMLEKFVEIVNAFDPDIMTGYNINNFDLPYITERMQKNDVRSQFGRCTQKPVTTKKIGIRNRNGITGRVVLDCFEVVKKDFSFQRYGLDFVAEKLLGKKKHDVKKSEIQKLWRGGPADMKKLADYCRNDSDLVMEILQSKRIADKYIALSKVSGTLLNDTLESGETSRIENYLLREFNREGYVFPCKPASDEVSRREQRKEAELEGGWVFEPIKELHSDVAVFDFKAMYPSIIISYNICPTTILKGELHMDGELVAKSGARFMPITVRQGIIPRILEHLTSERQAVKKKQKKETDRERLRQLEAKQWALKIMANAFYGHMGYSRARVYDLDIANAITATGRETIKEVAKTIEGKYNHQVVYGDTDSVFVKMDTDDMNAIYDIGVKMSSEISEDLPGVMELDFEKVFKRFLPLTKKRYAAWRFDRKEDGTWKDKIETKGIETVRRDWCPLVGETVQKVIEILLKEDDVKGALKYFKGVLNLLVTGQIEIQKLVITKTMTKSAGAYDGTQPHIELVKKMQARSPGEAPGIGDRISYVIVKGRDMLSKRTEDPEYVRDHGLQVDSQYYIENQLLPPIERIFKGLNISKSELLGNGRQMGLFDIIKTAKAALPEQAAAAESVPYSEVNGMVCGKCGLFYETPPLIGVCRCGGQFLFSTASGPAKSATLQIS
jgi:DNA polymerase I